MASGWSQGGASAIGPGGATLQTAYNNGSTIVETAGKGAVTIGNTLAGGYDTLDVSRVPVAAGTGNALNLSGGPNLADDVAAFFGGGASGNVLKLSSTAASNATLSLSSLASTNVGIESAGGQGLAVSTATTGRLRYNNATGTWQVSTQGGAYASLSTSAGTLQAAYNTGNTIVEAGGLAVALSSTTADNGHVLTLDKSPSVAHSGRALDITMGANSTGDAVDITQTAGATGLGLQILMATTGSTGVEVHGSSTVFYAQSNGTGPSYYANIVSGAGAPAVQILGNTQTVNSPLFTATQTWNAGGTTFQGIFLNVTNTASAAASTLLDLQVGSVSQFNVSPTGALTLRGTVTWPSGLGAFTAAAPEILGPTDQGLFISGGASASSSSRSVTVTGGPALAASNGVGGGVNITGSTGDGTSGGGNIVITAGATGSGSFVSVGNSRVDITGGAGGSGTLTSGGTVNIAGGTGQTNHGGLTTVAGGAGVTGTNIGSGGVTISTGTSTGSGSSTLLLKVAQVGASGTSTNTLQTALSIVGTTVNPAATWSGQYASAQVTCTVTLDWNGGNCQSIQLANNGQTFTFANPIAGGRYLLRLKQPASGAAGTVTWPGTVHWPAATAPTLTATNSQVDVITFYYDGTSYFGSSTLNYAP